eukprot:1973546-Rhodomonas_salina.2
MVQDNFRPLGTIQGVRALLRRLVTTTGIKLTQGAVAPVVETRAAVAASQPQAPAQAAEPDTGKSNQQFTNFREQK